MRIGKGNVLAIEINSPAGVRDARGAGAAPLIELRDVVFSYAGHMVVDGVSLQVNRGELVALLGPNGCGKTTIMRLINGLEVPSTGTYLFDGEMVDAAYLADPVRSQRFHQRVGFVFQNADAQLFCATVGEEVAFGPAQMGLPSDELERRVRDAMELFQVADLVDASPYQLSGGQKQRVAIARALATNPKILLCDEATSALDPATTESILSLIKDINRRLGITAIIITHEMSVIEKICNQVAIISHGRIAETGSVEEVFFHPQTEEARQLVIPEALQDMPHSRLYRIIFNGRSSFEPVISNLVLECGAPVNIMFADTRDIGGTAFGQMVLQLPDNEEVVRRILAYADSKGLMLEEMKNV